MIIYLYRLVYSNLHEFPWVNENYTISYQQMHSVGRHLVLQDNTAIFLAKMLALLAFP